MLSTSLFLQTAVTLSLWGSAEAADNMGPAAFLWPPDREWGAAQDNTPPCGSSAGVTFRTEFPLTNGAVSLVLQGDAYDVNLAVAYQNDPDSNNDFNTIVPASEFPEIDPGHKCYSVPNPPHTAVVGTNATLQLTYISEFEGNQNETYYACADITYVELANFKAETNCFNVSIEDPTVVSSALGQASATTFLTSATGKSTSATATPSSSSPSDSSSSSGSSGLSKGGIAGAAVGSIAGAAVLFVGGFFLWRRYQAKVKREKAIALRMNELTNPVKSTASSEH